MILCMYWIHALHIYNVYVRMYIGLTLLVIGRYCSYIKVSYKDNLFAGHHMATYIVYGYIRKASTIYAGYPYSEVI